MGEVARGSLAVLKTGEYWHLYGDFFVRKHAECCCVFVLRVRKWYTLVVTRSGNVLVVSKKWKLEEMEEPCDTTTALAVFVESALRLAGYRRDAARTASALESAKVRLEPKIRKFLEEYGDKSTTNLWKAKHLGVEAALSYQVQPPQVERDVDKLVDWCKKMRRFDLLRYSLDEEAWNGAKERGEIPPECGEWEKITPKDPWLLQVKVSDFVS